MNRLDKNAYVPNVDCIIGNMTALLVLNNSENYIFLQFKKFYRY